MIPQVFLLPTGANTPIISPCCLVVLSLCVSDNIRKVLMWHYIPTIYPLCLIATNVKNRTSGPYV